MARFTLYPLGSNGWIPSNNFETVCFVFFREDELFVIDAGTGIGRLLELKSTLFAQEWPKLKAAHVFLSHYHLDHMLGLFWGRAIFEGIPLIMYAPGMGVYGKSAEKILKGIMKRPYSPKPFSKLIDGVKAVDLDPPGLTVGRLDIKVKVNISHSDPSVSMRFGDLFAYVTDTPPENETVEFVRGVKVLLHESYYDSMSSYGNENDELSVHGSGPHTGTLGAGLIAKRAGVGKLVLVHHNPEFSLRDVEKGAEKVRERLKIDCVMARDLEEIEILE